MSTETPKKTGKHPGGRPSIYTKAIGDEICDRLAEGESLTAICKDDHLPNRRTIIRWILKQTKGKGIDEFCHRYAQARESQYELFFDQCQEIADNGTNDYMAKLLNNGDEIEVVNREHIQRSKLRIDTRMTILERMRPKKYGKLERHDHTTAGESFNAPAKEELAVAKEEIKKQVLDEICG